jgi:hypothetical protein
MKTSFIDWLATDELNVFITVTFKQALFNNEGVWRPITEADVKATAWVLRDRFTKALVGKHKKIPFIVFSEGDGFLKRRHIHILSVKPSNFTEQEFREVFCRTALKLDWVYNEIDIREITSHTQRNVISYSLKEGTDAFIPEASSLPVTHRLVG